jgi:polyisoprenyl-teichoic acid--peptidoglycan teichoic acid transferase
MSMRPHRTWTQRLVLSLNVLLVLGLLTAAVALVRYNDQVGQINRIAGQGTLTRVAASNEPINFLVVGVDNAEGLDPDDPVLRGRSEASLLSDTIMVVRVDPGANRAWLLSIPRDLWVTIAGTGTQGKINSALSLGGPQMLIDTVQTELDIPINHYVQVNFAGFRNLVEVIGGVPVWFDYPSRDQNSGLAVESPGCVNLEGEQALSFVRSRYFEILVGGEWVGDPTSDRGRIARQQAFIRAALNRAVNKGARNPFEMQRLINATQGEVVLDDSLSLDTLLGLGERFKDFNVDTFEVVTLPTDDGWAGSASVAYLREVEAQPLLAVFRGQTLFGTPNALVRVDVRNGTGVPGQAAEVEVALTDEGFTVVGTGDAPGYSGPTVIRYVRGGLLQAVLLVRYLGLDIPIEPAADGEITGDTGLLLITGNDWTGLLAEPLEAAKFQSYLDRFAAEVAADAAAGTDTTISGLTIDNLDDDAPVSVPAFTVTTITPERFVPAPPEGVECG